MDESAEVNRIRGLSDERACRGALARPLTAAADETADQPLGRAPLVLSARAEG